MNVKEASNDKRIKLLELQKAYRSGAIREQDLSEEQIKQLKKLYKTQIDFLKASVEKDKEEIIKIRKKLSINK